ncbi:MAG: GNAT family N-acetyltransferase [Aestuariivirga sp.]|nr:GNAT family N-acetyltransferase [Aestuariivirga sp.]
MEITVRKIEPGDKLTGFSLGDHKFTPLKTFLQKHAKQYQDGFLATTYGAFDEKNKICAYITILCGEVLTDGDQLVGTEIDYRYSTYPAVKIARLAVDSESRKGNIGRQLVELALGIATEYICPHVGCRFVMVDSKKDAVKFYEKCGFTMLDTEANHKRPSPVMYVDLSKI